ncbi:MAG: DinB family protein [Candidatus Dormibacteraeota bacterium]|nr:DinB family protein [Candidatus Dormibacteraeota bacterium]
MAPRSAIRHTREGVIARVEAEWEALSHLLRSAQPEDLGRPVFRRESPQMWTGKDVLAHLTEWQREARRVLRGEPRPPHLRKETLRAANARIYAEWRDRPLAVVLAEAERVHGSVMETIAALPDEFFSRRERSPQWPYDLVGHLAEHRRKHLEPVLGPPAKLS